MVVLHNDLHTGDTVTAYGGRDFMANVLFHEIGLRCRVAERWCQFAGLPTREVQLDSGFVDAMRTASRELGIRHSKR